MKHLFKIYKLFFYLVFMIAVNVFAVGPETGGGGGGYVVINNEPVLVDFFSFLDAQFIFDFLDKKMSVENRKDQSDQPEQFANMIFSQWGRLKAVSGLDYSPLSELANREWILEDQFEETQYSHFRPKYLNDKKEIKTAAFLWQTVTENKATVAIKINKPVLDKMKFYSRVGLYIHESLRFTQKGLRANFSEESLQQLTTLMMVCRPNLKLANWVLNSYFNNSTLNQNLQSRLRATEYELNLSDCLEDESNLLFEPEKNQIQDESIKKDSEQNRDQEIEKIKKDFIQSRYKILSLYKSEINPIDNLSLSYGYGQNYEEAQNNLIKNCLQIRCQNIGKFYEQSILKVLADSTTFDSQNPLGLKMKKEEAEQRAKLLLKNVDQMTCDSAPQSYKDLAIEGCFMGRIQFFEKK